MMRGVVVSSVIAVVILMGGIAYTGLIENVSRELTKINDDLFKFIENEDYLSAGKKADELTECLDKSRTLFDTTGNHEEFDKIEMNIVKLEGYIACGEKIDAVSHCLTVDFLLRHLPKNYRFTLENIL